MNTEQQIATFRETYATLRAEIGKVIVGHEPIVDGTLIAVFAGGHVLLEGVPGLGKTLLVRTLGEVLDLSFSRIQFTPDLMPADILGTNLVMETPDGRRVFEFQKGPVFAHLILADEINRATPKTQSAMLEAMQEKQVTAGGELRRLAEPFFVLATQNPIDQEGTYPLPEAQLDRFMFKILVGYPSFDEELAIAENTTSGEAPTLEPLLDRAEIINLQRIVRKVLVGRSISAYAVSLVRATRPGSPEAPDYVNKYLTWGAGTRACQALLLGAKAHALLDGRVHVSTDDIRYVAPPVMRHRLVTSFTAESDGVTADHIVEKLFDTVREPAE